MTEQKDSLNYCMGPEVESEAILAGLATPIFLPGPYKFGTDKTTPKKSEINDSVLISANKHNKI